VPAAFIAPSILASYVKWYFLGSAMGRSGPVVLLVQSSHVPKDELIKIEVPSLSLSLDGGQGYICFCSSRAGNARFFTWLFEEVVVPTVVKHRVGSKTESEEIFLSMDGEKIVLDALFAGNTSESIRLIELLGINRINVGKVSASTSGVLQANDVGPVFRLLKAALARIMSNPNWLEIIPNDLLDVIKAGVRSIVHADASKSVKDQIGRISQAVYLMFACMNKVLKPINIYSGFTWSGQSKDRKTFNFLTMMRRVRHRTSFQLADINNWKSQVAAHANLTSLNGNLTEAAMDACNLPKVEGDSSSILHDERLIFKQRGVWLNHPRILALYNAEMGHRTRESVDAEFPYTYPSDPPANPSAVPVATTFAGGGSAMPVAVPVMPEPAGVLTQAKRQNPGKNSDAYNAKLARNREYKRRKRAEVEQKNGGATQTQEAAGDSSDEDAYVF
jgi:hypothetical protein